MDCDYKDKISAYIDNELSSLDKEKFENELKNNFELNQEYLQVKNLSSSLSDLSKIKTSADFIVSLNKKIDAYESKKEKGFRTFLDNIFSNNYLPKISIVAMSLVCVFGLMYFLDFNSKNSSSLILSNSSTTNDTSINNGVADLDSLEINLEVDK